MYIHPSKRFTYNNVDNIEELAVDETTPEDLIIRFEEENSVDKIDRQELIDKVLDLGVLDELDIEVLMEFTTRQEAAKQLDVSYDTYRKRLQRKLEKLQNL
jgi:DNA-directed RNA polymerase specialized sigma24 family protein